MVFVNIIIHKPGKPLSTAVVKASILFSYLEHCWLTTVAPLSSELLLLMSNMRYFEARHISKKSNCVQICGLLIPCFLHSLVIMKALIAISWRSNQTFNQSQTWGESYFVFHLALLQRLGVSLNHLIVHYNIYHYTILFHAFTTMHIQK